MTPTRFDTDARFDEIVDELTRRGFLGGALGTAAALGLSACGSSAPSETSRPGAPWAFTDDLGRKVTVTHQPRRIVTLSAVMTYSVYSAGLTPVGAPMWTAASELRDMGMSGDDIDGIVKVDSSAEDNTIRLEAVAKANPDLIIDDVQGKEAYGLSTMPKLTQIAPVAALDIQDVPLDRGMSSVHRLVSSLGIQLTDAKAQARYDQVAAQLRDALTAKPGLRVAFGWGNKDLFQVNHAPQWNYMQTLAGLGMKFTPVATTKANPWAQEFSWETVSDIDSDLIVLTYYGVPTSPAWQTMPAVRAGQYVDMSDQWVVTAYDSYADYLQTLLDAVQQARVLH